MSGKKTFIRVLISLLLIFSVVYYSKKILVAEEISTEKEISTSETISTEEETQTEEIPDYKILFIGNSSTYYNNMPELVKGLAAADGVNVKVSMITAANYSLSQFANEENNYYKQIVETLNMESFDSVVLQDHRDSVISKTEKSKKAISSLKELIDQNGAQTVLYETQADSIGKNYKIDGTTVYLNHAQIQYYLNKNYYNASNEFDTLICPAGVNYTRCMQAYPEIELYTEDFIHPTIAGSYLTACSLYETIFGRTAFGNEFLPESENDVGKTLNGLTKEDAHKLQAVADVTLKFTNKTITMKKGESAKTEVTLIRSSENTEAKDNPENVVYYSLDDNVALVDQYTGEVAAVATGKTMIMARSESGIMTLCNVDVIEPATTFMIEEKYSIKIFKNDIFAYTAVMYPADTTDTITWKSDNPAVASVDETGVVKAKKTGVAKITAITDSGIKLTRKVYVCLKAPTKVKATIKFRFRKSANILFTWKANKKATGYYIFRSKKKKSGYKKIATVFSNRYIDKYRKKGKTFYYKVCAVYADSKCNSPKSKAAKIVIPAR